MGLLSKVIFMTNGSEAELWEQGNWQHLVLDNLKDYAVLSLDLSGTILGWNPGVESVLGYREGEIAGKNISIIFTPEDQRAGIAEREMAEAAEQGRAEDERWHLRADGRRFWATGVMFPLRDQDGTLVGFAKLLTDHTRRKEAEMSLQSLNEELEHRVEARTKQVRHLASQVTLAENQERHRIAQLLHDEVQQDLHALQFALNRLHKHTEIETVQEGLKEAEHLLRQAIRTSRGLATDFSPAVLKGEGLTEMLRWLAIRMQELHDLRVEVKAPADLSVPHEALRVLLFSVTRELLFNVVKHAGVNEATVTLRQHASQFEIEVSDPGQGFDPAHVTGGTAKETGLGLASVRERLSLLEGRLDLVSQPGAGTQVTVIVPTAVFKSS